MSPLFGQLVPVPQVPLPGTVLKRCSSARSPVCDTFQPHAELSHPGSPQSKRTPKQLEPAPVSRGTGCEWAHLGNDGLQLLGGGVALDGEVAELLPRLCLSPDQLLPELTSLLFHVVSLSYQILLHGLLFSLIRTQHLPHEDDSFLEEGKNWETTSNISYTTVPLLCDLLMTRLPSPTITS